MPPPPPELYVPVISGHHAPGVLRHDFTVLALLAHHHREARHLLHRMVFKSAVVMHAHVRVAQRTHCCFNVRDAGHSGHSKQRLASVCMHGFVHTVGVARSPVPRHRLQELERGFDGFSFQTQRRRVQRAHFVAHT